jgi:hypothetical protein
MKKALFSLLLALSSMTAVAQMGLHIGIMGGPQYTKIINDQPLDPNASGFKYVTTWGYAGMFKIGYNFVPPIGVHIGAIYSVQGQDYTTADSTGFLTSTSRRLTYLKIPLLLHMSSDPGPAMFTMEFGPQIGLLREASMTIEDTLVVSPYPALELFKPTDIAIAWSIGAEFCVTEGFHIVLQHRGDYGFLDFENKDLVYNGAPVYSTERKKANNLTLGIMLGLNFVITGGHTKVTKHYWGR